MSSFIRNPCYCFGLYSVIFFLCICVRVAGSQDHSQYIRCAKKTELLYFPTELI